MKTISKKFTERLRTRFGAVWWVWTSSTKGECLGRGLAPWSWSDQRGGLGPTSSLVGGGLGPSSQTPGAVTWQRRNSHQHSVSGTGEQIFHSTLFFVSNQRAHGRADVCSGKWGGGGGQEGRLGGRVGEGKRKGKGEGWGRAKGKGMGRGGGGQEGRQGEKCGRVRGKAKGRGGGSTGQAKGRGGGSTGQATGRGGESPFLYVLIEFSAIHLGQGPSSVAVTGSEEEWDLMRAIHLSLLQSAPPGQTSRRSSSSSASNVSVAEGPQQPQEIQHGNDTSLMQRAIELSLREGSSSQGWWHLTSGWKKGGAHGGHVDATFCVYYA